MFKLVLGGSKSHWVLHIRTIELRHIRGGSMALNRIPMIVGLLACAASADVLNMPAGQNSLQFVTVGNPGNAADPLPTQDIYSDVPRTGMGTVSYSYQIATLKVTWAQWAQFLNAVAANDTRDLYRYFEQSSDVTRSGVPGSWTDSPVPAQANSAAILQWSDAARFCNWLTNGQPQGSEVNGVTETGSYSINGHTNDRGLNMIVRNPNAVFVIPTENEWYKAAYYDQNKAGGPGYWLYPTSSDSPPSNLLDPIPSPSGTLFQGSDLAEWTEAIGIDPVNSKRICRGGSRFPNADHCVEYGPSAPSRDPSGSGS